MDVQTGFAFEKDIINNDLISNDAIFNNFAPFETNEEDNSFSFSFVAEDEDEDEDGDGHDDHDDHDHGDTDTTDSALANTSKKNVILVFAGMALIQFIGML